MSDSDNQDGGGIFDIIRGIIRGKGSIKKPQPINLNAHRKENESNQVDLIPNPIFLKNQRNLQRRLAITETKANTETERNQLRKTVRQSQLQNSNSNSNSNLKSLPSARNININTDTETNYILNLVNKDQEITNLKKEITNLKKEIQNLEEGTEDYYNKIQELTKQLEDTEKSFLDILNTLEKELKNNEENTKSYKNELRILNTKIEKLTEQIQIKTNELNTEGKNKEELQNKITQLQKEKTKIEIERGQLKKKIIDTREQYKNLEVRFNDLNKRLSVIKKAGNILKSTKDVSKKFALRTLNVMLNGLNSVKTIIQNNYKKMSKGKSYVGKKIGNAGRKIDEGKSYVGRKFQNAIKPIENEFKSVWYHKKPLNQLPDILKMRFSEIYDSLPRKELDIVIKIFAIYIVLTILYYLYLVLHDYSVEYSTYNNANNDKHNDEYQYASDVPPNINYTQNELDRVKIARENQKEKVEETNRLFRKHGLEPPKDDRTNINAKILDEESHIYKHEDDKPINNINTFFKSMGNIF